MTERNNLSSQDPWPGLQFYNEEDSPFFRGRKTETDDLLAAVQRNILTVVFGPSGTGKTSLVLAGLFPKLRSRKFLAHRIRLDHTQDLVGQVKSVLSLTGATLWECFHQTGSPATANVVVFDQFEEIFTLGEGRAESAEFLEQLGDLAENYIPAQVRERLERGETLDLDYDRRNYRIVIVMREDFVWRLDEMRKRMPSVMRGRMVVQPFTEERAIEAVKEPGHEIVEPDVAAAVVEFAASKGRGQRLVDPAILSLLCRELNKRRGERKTISRDQLQGDSAMILSEFWERSMNALAEGSRHAVRTFIEDRLVTPNGFRTAAPRDEISAHEAAVKQLIEGRVLRPEERFGTPHLELTHDVLCPVVLKSRVERQKRESLLQLEEARRQTEHELSQTRRRLMWVVVGATICLILAAISLWMWRQAVAQKHQAVAMREALAEANASMEQAMGRAVAEKKKAEEQQRKAEDALKGEREARAGLKAAEERAHKAEEQLLALAQSRAEATPLPPSGTTVGETTSGPTQAKCRDWLKTQFLGGDPKPFTGAEARHAAGRMGIEVPTLLAYLAVETTGVGFLRDGRPVILFERHFFHRLTKGKYDDGDISAPTPGGYGPTGAHQYERLLKAGALDCEAALKSASWGLPQIMGETYSPAGYPDVVSFVDAQLASEANQIRAFESFARTGRLLPALQAKDWPAFALAYNGPNFGVNRYAARLAAAYQQYANGNTPDFEMRAAQFRLTQLGFHPGAIDGVAGAATLAAIAEFQKQKDIISDGVLGARTKELLLGK